MATASEIDTYHKRLVSAINEEKLLGQKAAMRVTGDAKWQDDIGKIPEGL